MVTRQQILGLLSAVGCPLKAREIAVLLSRRTGQSLTRRDVNRVLYATESKDVFAKDDTYFWHMARCNPLVQSTPTSVEVARSFRVGAWPDKPVVAPVSVGTAPIAPISEAAVRQALGIPEPAALRMPARSEPPTDGANLEGPSKSPSDSLAHCLHCEKEFTASGNAGNRQKLRAYFCSDECYEAFVAYKYSTPMQAEVETRWHWTSTKLREGFRIMQGDYSVN